MNIQLGTVLDLNYVCVLYKILMRDLLPPMDRAYTHTIKTILK